MKEMKLVFKIAVDEACELPAAVELVYNCALKSYIFFI